MTTVHIQAMDAVLPFRRLTRSAVTAAGWRPPSGWNWSAVHDADEDALTLALAASSSLAAGDVGQSITSVGIASTSLPYRRRVQGTLLIEALGLDPGVLLTEHTTSSRAGTEALIGHAAHVAAHGGIAMVVASEAPGGQVFDESAVAVGVRLGRQGGLAIIDGTSHRSAEYPGLDFVPARGPRGRRDVEVADYTAEAYTALLRDAVGSVLAEQAVDISAMTTIVLAGVPSALARKGASAIGVAPGSSPLIPYGLVGDAGAAAALIGLLAALDASHEGDRILLTSYAGGSTVDAIVLTAGPQAGQAVLARRIEGMVDMDLPEFLRLRDGA